MIDKVIDWIVWLSIVVSLAYLVALVHSWMKRIEVKRETISFVGLVGVFASVITNVLARQEGVKIVLLAGELIFMVLFWLWFPKPPERGARKKQRTGASKKQQTAARK